MGGLDVGIPTLLVLLGTVFIGGSLLLIARLALIFKAMRTGQWNLPAPLWFLTAAVIADFMGAGALNATPKDLSFFFAILDLWFPMLLLSFSFVLISFFMLRVKPNQRIGLVRGISLTLHVLNVSGLVLYILARPGMPLN